MTSLLVYYSRTGSCKKLSKEISQLLSSCDIDEIIDEKNYSGLLGWPKASFNEITKKETVISYKKNASSYDNVLVITPVWAGGMTPATRQYIKKEMNGFKNLYILSVCRGSNSKNMAASTAKNYGLATQTWCITQSEKNKDQVLGKIIELLGK
ncbi:MAG: flavodoxin family protein [Clostridiales bacterium]|nr:flavodoxin family protein [Clostridiales bacterium]